MTTAVAPSPPHPIKSALPLATARLVRRYKRFLADVIGADGALRTVHCADPGAMVGLAKPGLPVVISDSGDARRKLRWSLEAVQVDDGDGRVWVGVHTGRPNGQVARWAAEGHLLGLPRGTTLRREVPYGGSSRVDLLAEPARGPPIFVEVKNTTLAARAADGRLEARFPDAVTLRGQKHLRALMDRVTDGDRAILLAFVSRADCVRFAPAADIDPTYASLLAEAVACGVDLRPLQVQHRVRRTPTGTHMTTRAVRFLPFRLDGHKDFQRKAVSRSRTRPRPTRRPA